MAWRIDLNCDLGEGGEHDEALLRLVTSANIACGVHAGDAASMRRVVRWSKALGVGIGAHPGLAGAGSMGRSGRPVTPQEAGDAVLRQVAALQAVLAEEGAGLQHSLQLELRHDRAGAGGD